MLKSPFFTRHFLAIIVIILIAPQLHASQNAVSANLIPVEVFAARPQLKGLTLSPSAEKIAFEVQAGEKSAILIQKLDGSDRKTLRAPAENTFAGYFWASPSHLIVKTQRTRSKAHAAKRYNLHTLSSLNLVTEEYTLLAQNENFQILDLAYDDKDHIIVRNYQRRSSYPSVSTMDLNTGRLQTLDLGKRNMYRWLMDRRGVPTFAYGWDDGIYYAWKKNENNEWQGLGRASWLGKFQLLALTEDPNFVYISDDDRKEYQGIYKLDIRTGKITDPVFTKDNADVTDLLFDTYTKRVIGYSYSNQRDHFVFTNNNYLAAQKQIDKKLFFAVNTITDKARDKQIFLVHAASDKMPGHYFIYDHGTKILKPIAPMYPKINPEEMADIQVVSYNARDGQQLEGLLTTPKGKKLSNLPTVIWPHGGPESRSMLGWNAFTQFLANRGYAVFEPNFRGSTGFGKTFQKAGKKQWGGLMQDDVTDGVNWIIEQGISNPERICIGGISYGGYAAVMGSIIEPKLFKCAISINGVLDLIYLEDIDTRFYGKKSTKAWRDHIGLKGNKLKIVSPYHQAEKLITPTLLISAKDDLRVPWEHAKKMHKRLTKLGKDSTYISLEDGGHSLLTLKSRKAAMEAMEKFLAKHIGN